MNSAVLDGCNLALVWSIACQSKRYFFWVLIIINVRIFPICMWCANLPHFPHSNIQMLYRNWMQSMILVADFMFLWSSVTMNHTRYTPAQRLSVQQCLVNFETKVPSSKLELQFFDIRLANECTYFICGNSSVWNTLGFLVLNKNKSLRVLKPHFSFRVACVNT